MECPRCYNTLFTKSGDCAYCIWTGDIGPGAQLRQIIKEINNEKKGHTQQRPSEDTHSDQNAKSKTTKGGRNGSTRNGNTSEEGSG